MRAAVNTLWTVLITNMPSGQWLDISDLYETVKNNFNGFTKDDLVPVTPYNKEPTWHRNLRNALQRRRKSGEILYDGAAKYQLPANKKGNNLKTTLPSNQGINAGEQLSNQIEDEIIEDETTDIISKTEGGERVVISRQAERNPQLRKDAIKIHGFICKGCGFDFKKTYGDWGQGFIEVHHLHPLGQIKIIKVETDPKSDLTVLCANCHRMVHRKRGTTLTIDELKDKIKNDV